ncbi:MAG: hypothetical protein U0V70_08720 [Terriglobia bacterium]
MTEKMNPRVDFDSRMQARKTVEWVSITGDYHITVLLLTGSRNGSNLISSLYLCHS